MPGPTATATRERVVALRQEGYKQTDIIIIIIIIIISYTALFP